MKNKIKYDDLLKIDYLYEMYYIIRKNTKHKDKIFKYELFLSSNLINILNKLKKRKYVHNKYNIFLIKDPKYRIIMSEKLDDKIVNHFVSKYILSYNIEHRLLDCNVATRVNKGTKEAYRLFKKYINKQKLNYDNLYVLKCDIKKYFYNINHEILIKKLSKIIYDKDCLNIIKHIINTTDYEYVNEEIEKIVNLEKTNILKKNISLKDKNNLLSSLENIPRYRPGYGLPIGNMTSQVLAIFYLNELDHFIKEKLRIKGFVQYMDDFILIHHDKNYLKYCLEEIKKFLTNKLDLELNNKTNIYDMKHGVNFLGYRFILKNKKLIIKIRNDSKKRIKKKYKYLSVNDYEKFLRVKASYNGYLKIANTNSLNKILEKY